MTLRLLLVDDHQIVRVGLRAVLAAEPDLEVVGSVEPAAEVIELAGAPAPACGADGHTAARPERHRRHGRDLPAVAANAGVDSHLLCG